MSERENQMNALLQRAINVAYLHEELTDTEADALEQHFLDGWAEK